MRLTTSKVLPLPNPKDGLKLLQMLFLLLFCGKLGIFIYMLQLEEESVRRIKGYLSNLAISGVF